MDVAVLLAGEPTAAAAFAKQTGLSPALLVAMLEMHAAVTGKSITLADSPLTIQ